MRSEMYLEHVRRQPCSHCRNPARSDPHHFGHRGMGLKASDFYTVPLCRVCHMAYHQSGKLGRMDAQTTKLWFHKEAMRHLTRFVEDMQGPDRNPLDRVGG